MTSVFSDSLRVAWIDMMFVRRNLPSVLVSSLVAPMLYVFAFGYGLGGDLTAEGTDYMSFMIPGIVAMTTLTACFGNVANKVMMQRVYYQSFDELYLCSVSPSSIILGKAYAGMMRGLISCSILYAAGLFLGADTVFSVWAAVFVVFSCLTYGLLGVACGMIANSYLALNAFNSLAVLPMTFLCGTIFSLEGIWEPVRAAIGLLPLTHTTDCARALMLGRDFPWFSMAVLVGWTVAFFLLSRYLMDRGRS